LPVDAGWGREQRPVINVSWDDAGRYSQWLGKQLDQNCDLPTEAEWEYAARAGTTTKYSWGNGVGQDNANCDGCGSEWDGKQTAPAGSFEPNRWDLYDMHGNVWEWVQDCWRDSYEGAPDDGSAWLEADGGNCRVRVLRGGSWYDAPDALRAAFRYGFGAVNRNVGFRVVCRPHGVERWSLSAVHCFRRFSGGGARSSPRFFSGFPAFSQHQK
ncbi:MAG: formylglycine-generating enzyme family protein, partial [Parahaliea sp.]